MQKPPLQWQRDPDDSSSSSDDSLFAAAAAATDSSVNVSGPMFPFSSLSSFPSSATRSGPSLPSQGAWAAEGGGNSETDRRGGGADRLGAHGSGAFSSTIRQTASFLSSSSSSDGDQFFGIASTRRQLPKPRTVKGTKTSFILGGKLGEGAYGTVREGIDEKTLRIVAVKILDLRRLRKMRGSLDGIEREVLVQKRLKRHPNLIELVDVVRNQSKSRMYIVLEIANGYNVQELAERGKGRRLPEGQVANIAHQALKGLEYMHGKGVVHRDIKPANMMLTTGGLVKISDFGVAEFLNEYSSYDEVNRTSGSPAFQAPEIATGAEGYSGMKVDVWALGVSIYYLVTGEIPFEADNVLGLFDRIAKGVYKQPMFVSESCRSAIAAMLRVDWHARASVDDLLRHPWIARGGVELNVEQREKEEWVPIVRREFSILDVVNNMYNNDDELVGLPRSQPETLQSSQRQPDPILQLDSSTDRRKPAGADHGEAETQNCNVG